MTSKSKARRKPPTPRWTPMFHHKTQALYHRSPYRFTLNPSGRRSGKTEILKRRAAYLAITCKRPNGFICLGAPTRTQAKDIFWDDMRKLIPKSWRAREDSLTDLSIFLVNGAEIRIFGLDNPARVEGRAIDFMGITEFGNVKEEAWDEHIRPGLSTIGRPGAAILEGTPEGRGKYYDMAMLAQERDDWGYFHWPSWDIIPEFEVEQARSELDELTFRQEYGGEFVTFSGRAYYAFDSLLHMDPIAEYRQDEDLHIGLDFNVDPGVAAIAQIGRPYVGVRTDVLNPVYFVDEIYIPRNSNTERVCREIGRKFSNHKADVYMYGDATGAARKTSALDGNDWDIVRTVLGPVFDDHLYFRVPRRNPSERGRVNSVNSKLLSVAGNVGTLIHPRCKMLKRDFEGVALAPDDSIDKKTKSKKKNLLTHISDGAGYLIENRFPIRRGVVEVKSLF